MILLILFCQGENDGQKYHLALSQVWVVGQLTINNNFQKRMNLESVTVNEKNSISKIQKSKRGKKVFLLIIYSKE